MVLFANREVLNQKIINKSKIGKTTVLGVMSLIVPVLLILLDPIHLIVNYNLRLGIGSILCNILQSEIKASHLSMYIFNITNSERFLNGDDNKLKVEEVGPFVFQEYLWYEDLEVSEDGTKMGLSPKYRSEFVPEESLAHPKDVNLNLLNVAFLSSVTFMSNYDVFTQSLFNTLTFSLKPIITLDVHSFLWGYNDPFITSIHAIAPSLVYFNSIGLFDRFYDNQTDYRITVAATNKDRFKIKTVKKTRHTQNSNFNNLEVTELNFTDTYEGTGYPPDLTPDLPINLYRMGICKTFKLQCVGSKRMEYGGEGLVYKLSNENFEASINPITKKKYPYGLMDISSCYYGMPFVLSRAHFIDADPILLDRIDGLNPERESIANEFVIDRRVGIPFYTKASVQLNMALDDLSYNRGTKNLANTVIPICRLDVNQPRMSDGIIMLFYLVYMVAPYSLIVIEIILIIIGLALLAKSAKSIYCHWHTKGTTIDTPKNKKPLSGVPLIINDRRKSSFILLE